MSEVVVRERCLKSGKKVYEYCFELAPVGGKRRRKTKSGFASKREARTAGRQALSEYERGGEQVLNNKDLSYADYLDYWIDNDCKISCKSQTITGYEKKIRLYIKPQLGAFRLSAITKKVLQDFITDIYNDGFSINTVVSIKGIITKSFNFAVDHHFIPASPAVNLIVPKNMQPDKPTRHKEHIYLNKDQVDRIFARFPKGTSSFIPLQIAYRTGMRPGEIFGLIWDDIDLENKLIHVRRQVQWYQTPRSKEEKRRTNGTAQSDGYWFFSEPKYQSYRTIDIDDTLVAYLTEEFERQKKAEKYYEEFYTHYFSDFKLQNKMDNKVSVPMNRIRNEKTDFEIKFVCRREDGSFITPRTLQHVSQIVHKQLDIANYDTYSFRHTHGTMLVEQGADMVYIQRRLGHKDIKITLNIYTNHLTNTIISRNSVLLNNMF